MKIVDGKDPRQCAAYRCSDKPDMQIDLVDSKVRLCSRHFEMFERHYGVSSMDLLTALVHVDPTPAVPSAALVPAVDAEVATARAEASELRLLVETLEIATAEDLALANDVLVDVKARARRIAERREEITRPMNTALKSVRDLFRPIETELSTIEATVKRAIAEHSRREEAVRRAAMTLASEAHAAGDAELRSEALAVASARVAHVPGLSTYDVWDFVVEDPAAVPRKYLEVDETAIRRLCGSVQRPAPEIPGVRFFPKTRVVSRGGAS